MSRITQTSVRLAIAATAIVITASAASAQGVRCNGVIRAESGTQQALTPATDGATPARIKRSYDAAFAIGRRQAIAAWHDKVQRNCRGASSLWFRAANKRIEECDRAMGGRFTVCAIARPARRYF